MFNPYFSSLQGMHCCSYVTLMSLWLKSLYIYICISFRFLPAGSGTDTFSKYTIASNGVCYKNFYNKNISVFFKISKVLHLQSGKS